GCSACGGPGQPCCESPGSRDPDFCTGAGLACHDRSCQRCGAPGEPCCPGNVCAGAGCCVGNECVAAGTVCGSSSNGVCDTGTCRGAEGPCGGLDQPYCSGSYCTAPYTTDYSSTCESCGAEGLRCCGGYDGYCGSGLACDFDSCQKCGLSGQPCCGGVTCTTGLCDNGTCP
ncbi:MAG: hypothetical protein FJ104_11580, partial [Deltaproteobacteria bacterium]|nr:hypothetical protein [Deltaproteobacteria bacterium]